MSSAEQEPPGSPPELSSSKSSARSSSSSTLRSVAFPDDDSSDENTYPHVALAADDELEKGDAPTPLPTLFSKVRPPLRPAKSTGPAQRDALSSPTGLRLTATRNAARNQNTPLRIPSNPSSSLSPPSPSRPFGPSRSNTFSTSPRSPRSPLTPRLISENTPALLGRRNSWLQSGSGKRKTAKELEAEYDDLDEEDLPEDAIIFNVPLSPRPQASRSHSATTLKAGPSTSNSPERTKNARAKEKSPRRTSPERGDLKAPAAHTHRTKSWDEAMRELSADARKITEALEVHCDSLSTPTSPIPSRRSKSDTSMSKSASATSTIRSPASSSPERPQGIRRPSAHRTQSVTLPPVQYLSGSVDADPVPMSKEKERLLTRTRPSWLPPKCPKEERKHLKEWERMMARARANGNDTSAAAAMVRITV